MERKPFSLFSVTQEAKPEIKKRSGDLPKTLPETGDIFNLTTQPDGGVGIMRKINAEFNPLDKIVPGITF